MCSIPTMLGAGLSIYGNYVGQKAMARPSSSANERPINSSHHPNELCFQDYEMERTDAFDAAVAELDKVSLNAMQVNSGVEAAVNETMSGRTARLLIKDAEADTARTKASIRDNYDRKANEVDLNKERTLLSTKDYINNLNASAPKMPSRFSNFLSTAGVALDAYTQTQNQRQAVKNTGAEWNWLTNGAKRTKGGTN